MSDESDPAAVARIRRAVLCLRFAMDVLDLPDVPAGDALGAAAAAVQLAQSDLWLPGVLAPSLCGLSDTGLSAPRPRPEAPLRERPR